MKNAIGSFAVWIIVGLCAVTACPASAEISSEVRDTAYKLAGLVYTGPSMKTLRELSDGFGAAVAEIVTKEGLEGMLTAVGHWKP